MSSLLSRIGRFFRGDAANQQIATSASQQVNRRHDALGGIAGGWFNPATGFGMAGEDSRTASAFRAGLMTDELAAEMWIGDALTGKIVSTLPMEAMEPGFTLTIQDEESTATGQRDTREAVDLVADVERVHRELKTEAMIVRACEWERLFGGAAIWAGANDYRAQNWSAPLDMESPRTTMRWLSLVRSRDMTPVRHYSDPAHPRYGEVEVWRVSRTIGGGQLWQQAEVHESRLHLFRGRRIVDDGTVATQNMQSVEFGDGIIRAMLGTIRRFSESLDNAELSMRANGELIWQHQRLAEVLAADNADDFAKLVRAMKFAQSVLNARVVGADQTLTRQGVPLSGLDTLITRFENELAAIAEMPRTKLFGEAPGGLGNNSAGPHGDWDETKAAYRKKHQQPAMEWVTKLVMRSLGGEPKRWKLEGRPFRHPSETEKAGTTKLEADTDIALHAAGLVTQEEVRARSIWRERFALPDPNAEPMPEVDLSEIPDDIRMIASGEEGKQGKIGPAHRGDAVAVDCENPVRQEGGKFNGCESGGSRTSPAAQAPKKATVRPIPRVAKDQHLKVVADMQSRRDKVTEAWKKHGPAAATALADVRALAGDDDAPDIYEDDLLSDMGGFTGAPLDRAESSLSLPDMPEDPGEFSLDPGDREEGESPEAAKGRQQEAHARLVSEYQVEMQEYQKARADLPARAEAARSALQSLYDEQSAAVKDLETLARQERKARKASEREIEEAEDRGLVDPREFSSFDESEGEPTVPAERDAYYAALDDERKQLDEDDRDPSVDVDIEALKAARSSTAAAIKELNRYLAKKGLR